MPILRLLLTESHWRKDIMHACKLPDCPAIAGCAARVPLSGASPRGAVVVRARGGRSRPLSRGRAAPMEGAARCRASAPRRNRHLTSRAEGILQKSQNRPVARVVAFYRSAVEAEEAPEKSICDISHNSIIFKRESKYPGSCSGFPGPCKPLCAIQEVACRGFSAALTNIGPAERRHTWVSIEASRWARASSPGATRPSSITSTALRASVKPKTDAELRALSDSLRERAAAGEDTAALPEASAAVRRGVSTTGRVT